ncbi:unnamed protein product [Leptosia nina]|uniref:Uncharacterized protein n=1 Tax=Leptosia nina TaxID=320188 RepID=A0AAV1J220_9NEOP
MTPEMKNVYVDQDGNIQFQGYLLEEGETESEDKPTTSLTEEALTKILAKFSEVKKDSIKKLTDKFVIEKYSRGLEHLVKKNWDEKKFLRQNRQRERWKGSAVQDM